MKKLFIRVFLLLLIVVPSCAGSTFLLEAGAGGQVLLPNVVFGPVVEIAAFPIAIPIGQGAYNRLGMGVDLDFPIRSGPAGSNLSTVAEGLVEGRFNLVERFPVDAVAGVGWRFSALPHFYGAAGIRIGFLFVPSLMLQLSGGYRFWVNPDYASDIYNNPQFISAYTVGLGLVWRILGG
jgi:hypothetical protein